MEQQQNLPLVVDVSEYLNRTLGSLLPGGVVALVESVTKVEDVGSVEVMDVLFWVVNVLAGMVWFVAILFPKTKVAHRLFSNAHLVALPFTFIFLVLVLPRLQWWLALFINSSLSLSSLVEEFSNRESFLLLWLYILGFDIAVFGALHTKMYLKKTMPLEMSLWAVLGALCAPVALCLYTLVDLTIPPPEQQQQEQELEVKPPQSDGSEVDANNQSSKDATTS